MPNNQLNHHHFTFTFYHSSLVFHKERQGERKTGGEKDRERETKTVREQEREKERRGFPYKISFLWHLSDVWLL